MGGGVRDCSNSNVDAKSIFTASDVDSAVYRPAAYNTEDRVPWGARKGPVGPAYGWQASARPYRAALAGKWRNHAWPRSASTN